MKAQLMLTVFHPPRHLRADYERRPWCAEILPGTQGKLWDRKFLECRHDIRQSNGKGTQGIRRCYVLETGPLYEAQRQTGWQRAYRVFLRVTENGNIQELDRQEVLQWLRKKV